MFICLLCGCFVFFSVAMRLCVARRKVVARVLQKNVRYALCGLVLGGFVTAPCMASDLAMCNAQCASHLFGDKHQSHKIYKRCLQHCKEKEQLTRHYQSHIGHPVYWKGHKVNLARG